MNYADILNTIKPVVTAILKTQPTNLPDMFEWVGNNAIGMKPFNEDGNLNELILEAMKGKNGEIEEDLLESLQALLSEYNPRHLFTAGVKSDGGVWMTGIGVKCKDKTLVITFGKESFPYTFMNMTRNAFTSRDGSEYIKLCDTRHNGVQLPVYTKKGIGQPSLKAIKAEPWAYIEPVSNGGFGSVKSYHAMIEQGKVYTGSVVYKPGSEPIIHVETCDGEPVDFDIKVPAKNSGSISRLVSNVTFRIDPSDAKEGYTKDGKTYQIWSKPLDILEVKISSIRGLHNL